MDFEQRYRVIAGRDRRFDGQFITAVRTTGIYCRPSCPARTPRPENVTFFSTSAAAHLAGYRACKRCLPEAVPGTPEWDLRDDLVGRAMRLIADGEVERAGVGGLASRLGYTTRHLTRVLTEELGAGPLALARAVRAQTARTLLVSTDLPITDVAFAAGFASVRQFNDTIGEVFQLTPTAIRAQRSAMHASPGRIELRLATREPFDAAGTFRYLAEHADLRTERASDAGYARPIVLPRGTGDIEVRADGAELKLSVRLDELRDLPVAIARVRRLFDLDADPQTVDAALAEIPALREAVRTAPGIRVPGALEASDLIIRAAAGETHGRAARRADLDRAQEREAVQSLAEQVDSGWSASELSGELERLGVSAASRAYAVSRILGSPDVDCSSDDIVRRGMRRLGLDSRRTAGETSRLSPWRSYAALHFRSAGRAPRPTPHSTLHPTPVPTASPLPISRGEEP
ncbi:bifunctional transcriptional activator/DNA repair enzyme AdaA [Naasia lichenicola]|uniref:Helix-turn-helix domain-containing protein n=1 Tax=Naasia lichenicola TaxID=2565933 RepID=A0A4S4FET8_9MICO|nr:Ada metal-binding domain-containing protein [Naasia lichenicola]THG28603.1 helix-turn-helix domain-containing protein [Naasia lichenicola]